MSTQATFRRARVRETGLVIGNLPTGPNNAITDVQGVLVGQETVWFGDGPLVPSQGPARTGVTAILPHGGNLFREKVPAAFEVINGFGKAMGMVQVNELGTIETPIVLTSTLCIGRAADAVISHAIRENPEIGITTGTVNPVVGECNDAYLNDIQGRHVTEGAVLSAIDRATGGLVAEGCVGAGTGMRTLGFKGGIGTASRVIPRELGGWTVGVLVQSNFGTEGQLVIDGVPIGKLLLSGDSPEPERGSIMMVVATDAPLLDRGLGRVARRTVFGLARTGSMGGHGSGDIAIAFSTSPAVRMHHYESRTSAAVDSVNENAPSAGGAVIDALFAATIEATEEAILNALFAAITMVGRDGHVSHALPLERVATLLRGAGRIL